MAGMDGITHDIWDEIPLTRQAPHQRARRRTARHQIGERQEVLYPEAGPPAAEAEVGIGRHEIRPIDRHGAQAAVGVLEGDAILSPELLGDDEPERLPPEGMKRVRDPNLRWISQHRR